VVQPALCGGSPIVSGQHLAFSAGPSGGAIIGRLLIARAIVDEAGAAPRTGIVPVYPLTGEPDRSIDIIPPGGEKISVARTGNLTSGTAHRRGYPSHSGLATIMPPIGSPMRSGKKRFIYEEFLVLQLALGLKRSRSAGPRELPPLPSPRG